MPLMARGDFAAMDAAVLAAATCSAAASGKTSVTSPMALASCALKTRAVSASSLALPTEALQSHLQQPPVTPSAGAQHRTAECSVLNTTGSCSDPAHLALLTMEQVSQVGHAPSGAAH